jgi:hypothetical protein
MCQWYFDYDYPTLDFVIFWLNLPINGNSIVHCNTQILYSPINSFFHYNILQMLILISSLLSKQPIHPCHHIFAITIHHLMKKTYQMGLLSHDHEIIPIDEDVLSLLTPAVVTADPSMVDGTNFSIVLIQSDSLLLILIVSSILF